MPSPSQITVPQLKRLIGTPESPVIIDVRVDEDFQSDPRLIPTSNLYPFKSIHKLVPNLSGKKVVVVCQKGLKLSEGAAAILRSNGIKAESLLGGYLAWYDAGATLIPAASIPEPGPQGMTMWVTRSRPKIDRIACPWLIKRFIDPDAQFLFVASSEVLNVADRFGATPFDIENVFWSHRGDQCTFDTMVEEFKLESEAINRLATIVRGADTNKHDLAPEAAGLLASSLGLSRMFRDDLAQLNASMILYDAMYRWARDATEESHDWPASSKSN